MPGNPIDAYLIKLAQLGVTIPSGSLVYKTYIQEFGLDKDLLTQFVLYIRQILKGDLGVSIMAYPENVSALLLRSLPWSLVLLLTTTIIAWVIGNILGAFIGWSSKKRVNAVLVSFSLVLNQIPYYIFAIILVMLFVYYIPLFPSSGGYDIGLTPGFNAKFFISMIRHAILPALSIIVVAVTSWMLSMRALVVSILGDDYLMFAKAKGLRKHTILMKYAFRNALLPQVTGLALGLGSIVNGALLTEYVFAYPGIGWLFLRAFGYRDYIVMQAGFLFLTLSVLGACFLIDILYPLLDPRVRRQ
jgi:peptide/nickel transport system permease protein